MGLPSKLAFLDLETTGTSPTRDRIIEVGILRVEDNVMTDKFESLVDPDVYLPPEITMLTGIQSEELNLAPTMRAIKDKIDELTQDAVVVAHNARFDISFLKAEYDRLGDSFKNKSLCTARLSRSLFPRFRRHNLDSIIERYGFDPGLRHRAFSDAKVLWDFYKMLLEKVENEKLTEIITKQLKKTSLPHGLKEEMIDKLPKKPGVYIFYGDSRILESSKITGQSQIFGTKISGDKSLTGEKDEKGHKNSPLYVGKSVNIHDRVLSHFNSTHTSGRELSIASQVTLIEHEETVGEMAALLREKVLIAKLQPIYNRQLRLLQKMTILKKTKVNGYESLEMVESSEINPENLDSILGVFRSRSRAKDALNLLADEHKLCHKLLSLEKGKGACFRRQLEKCNGACIGEEIPIKYNLRFIEAFSKLKIKQWPFNGAILYKEGEAAHLIYKWCYLGEVSEENPLGNSINLRDVQFDFDTYKILSKFLLKNNSNLKIQVVPLS